MASQSIQPQNDYFHLLVVDDDPLIHQSFKLALPPQWKMSSATNVSELPDNHFFHAAFVDMHLKKALDNPEGPEVVRKLHLMNVQTDIIGMSGDLSLELMEQCLKNGAQKFLAKPLMREEVILILDRIEAYWKIRSHHVTARNKNKETWIGESSVSQQIQKKIAQLKGTDKTVLIEGPTGTGKEVVARLLHLQEPPRPWITVNLGAIPENLFESEFFGHVKGSFTGADQNKVGLIEAANGGDLFLDEIEALPLTQQVKLLRFLETGELRKVGSQQLNHVKVRIICATNRSLKEMVKKGEFREDLYFRLCSTVIELPALSNRTDDIPELTEFFFGLEKNKIMKKFSPEALDSLKKYNWPGNVRELKRICEQLYLTSPLPIIRADDVKSLLSLKPSANENDTSSINFSDGLTLEERMQRYEANLVRTALLEFKDIEETANRLGISRSNLYKKIKDYRIEV